MRKLFFIVLIIFFSNEMIFAQCLMDDSDPGLSGTSVSEMCTNEGNSNTVTIGWQMICNSDISCTAPAGSWYIQITFPGSGVYGISGLGNIVDGSIFTWYWDGPNNTLRGFTNQAVTFGQAGSITLSVDALVSNACENVTTLVNLFRTGPLEELSYPAATACNIAFQDSDLDNQIDFTFGIDTSLPIIMSSFRGQVNNCQRVDLDWTTVSEISNDKFIVERRLADKVDWVAVGEVKGAGTSNVEVNYAYTDEMTPEMKKGAIYYRLKQVDFNGKTSYSDVISLDVNCEEVPEASVFPNPVVRELNVQLPSLWEGDSVVLEFFNEQGKLVRVENIAKVTDLNIQYDISELPSGIYNLKMSNSGSTFNKRFVRMD